MQASSSCIPFIVYTAPFLWTFDHAFILFHDPLIGGEKMNEWMTCYTCGEIDSPSCSLLSPPPPQRIRILKFGGVVCVCVSFLFLCFLYLYFIYIYFFFFACIVLWKVFSPFQKRCCVPASSLWDKKFKQKYQ